MSGTHSDYLRKRNFDITSEPRDDAGRKPPRKDAAPIFVIQKHHARNLHYDLRLELDGTLKSWAVPKGPSLDPEVKRLAVHVEDHPLAYADFEGDIPPGQYGAGHMIVWDTGTWQALDDPQQGYRKGKLKFSLSGQKLSGVWNLIRTRFKNSDKDHWLLIKEADAEARPESEYDILQQQPDSVKATASKPAPRKHPARKNESSAGMPLSLKPQLAVLSDQAPSGDWLYEIKFDGYRVLTRIKDGEVRLFTRNGLDWTDRMPAQAKALAGLKLKDSWLDGEIVVNDEHDLPDFQALQNALDAGRSSNIVYFLFDAPWLNARDLREQPLIERREALQAALNKKPHPLLKFSEAFPGTSYQSLYQSACRMSLEGLIAKRPDSLYRSARSDDWRKLKCRLRQEFIIVGYTEPQGSRHGFGSLLLAVNGEQGLIYCGKVGTGFNAELLTEVHSRLKKLLSKKSPLDSKGSTEASRASRGTRIHWLKPLQVCEVEFAQWTSGHLIRHAVFVALREDKPAREILRETGRQQDVVKPADNTVAGVRISSHDRVIDAGSGATKIDLALFYQSISHWLLPHLNTRPVSLLRAPEGVDGEQFFQKHAERLAIPNIKHLDPALDPGHAALMEIDSAQALIGAVQMGSIEFHTWGASHDRIERPDRIILDLDPDPALPWSKMIEATRLLLSVLDELGLQSFLKTSGGKGMHVIIPIARHLEWDAAKDFARSISQFMQHNLPERFVAKMGPKNRINRIFIDYLRNSRGASTVAAFSVRARPGLPVSVPIAREELDTLQSASQWHIGNLLQRLQTQKKDPWHAYENRQRISQKMLARLQTDKKMPGSGNPR